MTSPTRTLPPPLDPYHRPARELAGYAETNVDDGDEIVAPTVPSNMESITLLTVPGGMGYQLNKQPAAVTDYLALDKVKFDAAPYNAARVVVNVYQPGATGARAVLRYSTSGLLGTFTDAGIDLSGNVRSLGPTIDNIGVRVGSGPIAVASRDDVYWEVVWDNGDGVVTPIIGAVFVQFMQKTFKPCTWTTIVTPAQMLTSGNNVNSDPDWTVTGNPGMGASGFQSGCVAPSCLGHISSFRFGSGAPIDIKGTRVFSPANFPVLLPGTQVRLVGEMSWTYLFRTCPDLNTTIRLTLAVNGVTYTNVPSGFPPYDTDWNQVEVEFPADGTGVTFEMGIFGDTGACSVSLNGAFRNFRLDVLDDGSGGQECI